MNIEEYRSMFLGNYDGTTKQAKALALALDIRKFEIELYWKRATYFWALIAAAFVGYASVQTKFTPVGKEPDITGIHLSALFGCLGLSFSFAWYCINRGSKYWQVNWEKHVDLLECNVLGPLYKTIVEEPSRWYKPFSAYRFSASKINTIVSLYVTVIWVILILCAIPSFHFNQKIDWFLVGLIVITLVFCVSICTFGKTGSLTTTVKFNQRKLGDESHKD